MTYLSIFVVVGVAGAASASVASECTPATDVEVQAIKESFKFKLPDNEGARFAEVCRYSRGRADQPPSFCGRINATNTSGGYDGFRRFYSVPVRSTAEIEGIDDLSFPKFWCLTCTDEKKPFGDC